MTCAAAEPNAQTQTPTPLPVLEGRWNNLLDGECQNYRCLYAAEMLTLLLTHFIDLLLTPQVAFQELRRDLNHIHCLVL